MDEKTRPNRTTNSPRSAEEDPVAREIAQKLAVSGRFGADRLEVSTSEGVVKLQGRVASYYHKQVAQVVALSVIGARQLVNEIEVA